MRGYSRPGQKFIWHKSRAGLGLATKEEAFGASHGPGPLHWVFQMLEGLHEEPPGAGAGSTPSRQAGIGDRDMNLMRAGAC